MLQLQITETSRKRSLHCDLGAVSARQYFTLDALKGPRVGPVHGVNTGAQK